MSIELRVATERVALSIVISAHALIAEDEEPVLPFDAWRAPAGRIVAVPSSEATLPITITALLERTAAFHTKADRYDTGVLRFDLVFVDPTAIVWRTKIVDRFQKTTSKARWNGARIGSAAASGAAARKRSDERALANREQVERQRESERQQLAARRASTSTEPIAGAFEREAMSQTKTCRVCSKDKPRDSFPKTGRNAQRCFSCAEAQSAIPAESKATPIAVPRLPELTISATPVELAPILAALTELNGLREFKRRVLELANA